MLWETAFLLAGFAVTGNLLRNTGGSAESSTHPNALEVRAPPPPNLSQYTKRKVEYKVVNKAKSGALQAAYSRQTSDGLRAGRHQLGAGCGLVGLAIASMGYPVFVTEVPTALGNLAHNIGLNEKVCD